MLRDFKTLLDRVKGSGGPMRVALVEAQDEHALEAVLLAAEAGIVVPILVGDEGKIRAAVEKLGRSASGLSFAAASSEAASAWMGVELVRDGDADFLMKGKLQTADLLKAVVAKEGGLRTGSVMSHVAVFEVPAYHKLLALSDSGMVTYPDLEQKKAIIENAVGVLRRLGYDLPKVAVLAAVETLNPKMPETVDAAELKRMNAEGSLAGCVVEGPISFDLAVSAESAGIKGYSSPVAGDADLLVVPTIVAGNVLGKCLTYMAGAKMAGIVVGAKAPIVLTSRGASADEKHLSLLMAAAYSRAPKESAP